jgi:hypothetical protein
VIIADKRPMDKVLEMLESSKNVLVVGCRSCTAICLAGGEKEASLMREALLLHAQEKKLTRTVDEFTIERACEKEFVELLEKKVEGKDAILCLACGVGAQCIQERYSTVRVIPGVSTSNMGAPTSPGVFEERCAGCGDCVLHLTGGVCPIARCSKSLLNGPCGGSQNGKCEISKEVDCGWDLVYHSLERLGRLDLMEANLPPKDWRPSRNGGPRKIIRPEGLEQKAAEKRGDPQ